MSMANGDLRHALAGSALRATPSLLRTTFMLAVVMVAAVAWQMRWGTIPDTSWIITMVEGVLTGDRLYVDIFETNPPFTLWLYMPPVIIAKALEFSPEIAVHAYTYGLVLLGLGLAAIILHRGQFRENAALLRYSPAFLALFVIFPGIAFSEREHLGVALVLPLFALMARRADNKASLPPHLCIAVLAGFCGSVIVLVKPYYALTILAPALLVAWRIRRPFLLFEVEYWIIGAVAVGYLALVHQLHPEFFTTIYPVLADTYLLVTTRGSVLLHYTLASGPLLVLIWWIWPRDDAGDLAWISLAASLASFVPLVYQGKGWGYHAYPAIAFAIITLICLLSRENSELGQADSTAKLRNGRRKPVLALVAVCVGVSWVPFALSQRPAEHLVQAVREAAWSPTVALIGSDMAYGHPIARMVGGRWTSRYCADWLGAFALYLSYMASEDGDKDKAAFYRQMLEEFVREKKNEFEPRPDIVLFQTEEAFWTQPLLSEFGFAEILDEYRVLAEDDKLRIYIRADYVKPVALITPPAS